MNSLEALQIIKETGIIAILRGTAVKETFLTIEALLNAGIKMIEITFNTLNADRIISKASEEYKSNAVIGAGTVTNITNTVKAIECGAEFILAPNMDLGVIYTAKKYNKLIIPGAFTPTEVLKCYNAGADIVKIFPASSVGPKYIKDLKGPYEYINMMPVGGVNLENAQDFIRCGAIALGVGGNLINKEFISTNNYKGIEELAKKYIYEIKQGQISSK